MIVASMSANSGENDQEPFGVGLGRGDLQHRHQLAGGWQPVLDQAVVGELEQFLAVELYARLDQLRVHVAAEEGTRPASTSPDATPRSPGPRRARARWVSDAAARMLPPADRVRYRDEYLAELSDLPRRDQMAHAVRLACRTWPLRRALRSTGSNARPVRVPAVSRV
jgi:hypothetical protein